MNPIFQTGIYNTTQTNVFFHQLLPSLYPLTPKLTSSCIFFSVQFDGDGVVRIINIPTHHV
jgi:hypothetical protein